jgi:hypothetical protein
LSSNRLDSSVNDCHGTTSRRSFREIYPTEIRNAGVHTVEVIGVVRIIKAEFSATVESHLTRLDECKIGCRRSNDVICFKCCSVAINFFLFYIDRSGAVIREITKELDIATFGLE